MARICRSVNARPLETEILVSLFDEWEAFVKSYSKRHWFSFTGSVIGQKC